MKPLTYKLYFQEDDDDFFDDDQYSDKYWDSGLGAAGCIFIAKDTGRILMAHRSGRVLEPHTWGTWGGKVDEGESPTQAVVREIEEETGYEGQYKLSHLWTFKDEEAGFQYHNYLVLVQFEFTPKLNWETDNSEWVEWGEWPTPMHFGLRALLDNAGAKIRHIIKLIKRKHSDILEDVNALPSSPPAIIQKAATNAPAILNITNAYILAATLWGEAADQGEEGQQAVMNVIMNRAKGSFTNAVKIALMPKQFSMWNGVTNPVATALENADVWRRDKKFQKCFQVVDQAFQGTLPDITGGAIFYFNPNKANPSWAKRLVHTATIGDHEFYKLPPKKVKKKVPTAIREMIEKQNPNDAVVFKGPLIGDGIWKYELRSPFSVIKYRFSPKQKLFYLDNIATPNVQNQGQGYASAILETFFRLIKQYNGALDCDTYTSSGMEKIKPAVEKFAQQFGVRLVRGEDSDDVDNMAESNIIKEGYKPPRYGDPGHHVVWGGLWSTGRIVAHIVKDRQDPNWGHSRDMGPRRFVYFQEAETLFWHDPPDEEDKDEVTKWLNQHGYDVKRHMADSNKWDVLAGLEKKREKKDRLEEGERLDYLNGEIAALEAEWERLDSQGNRMVQQQEIQKQLTKLRREKSNWDRIYQAVNGPITENKLLMEAITEQQAKAAVNFLKFKVANGPFKGQVFLAGGPVRDMVLGKTPKDLDISIVSNSIWGALRFTSWLAQEMGNYKGPNTPPPTFDKHIEVDDYGAPKTSPVPNDAAIGRAIEAYDAYYAQFSNPVIFPKFGTAKLNLKGVFDGVDLAGVEVEAVSARKEIYEPGNRKPIEVLPGTLEDDVFRRDFRCNSLMYDLTTGQTHDLTGKGVEDIKNHILVTTSNPEMIFQEDPLRMLRAVRFMVQKGFQISPETEENIRTNAAWLQRISRERIRDEVDKILVTKDPGSAFRKMHELGLLQYVSPEFERMIGMTQNVHHTHDVFDHTMAVLSKTQPELVRRRIALFHDIGKLVTRSVTPTGVHFYGHEDAGPEVAEKVMASLKYPTVDIDAVKIGIANHMKLKHGGDDAVALSDKVLRKFKIAVGEYLDHILDVINADNLSHADASAMPNQIEAVRQRLKNLNVTVSKPALPITGNDILALGIKPGKMVGQMLSVVTDAWYENPNLSRDDALALVKKSMT